MPSESSKKLANLLVGALACIGAVTNAAAQDYLVMRYNDDVRIVLSDIPCPGGQGWRATAQRIDNLYLRACWTREPQGKLIRLQWEGGDFSLLDSDRFSKVQAH